jgi:Mg2+ and Co2+ transporter CorA
VWLNAIDELFQFETRHKDDLREWTKLSRRLRSLNDVRVRLAHHTIHHQSRDEDNPTLKPARFDLRTKSQKYAALEIEHIIEFIATMTETIRELTKMLDRLRAKMPASARKSLQRATDPPKEDVQ